jgi:hypothetical protein
MFIYHSDELHTSKQNFNKAANTESCSGVVSSSEQMDIPFMAMRKVHVSCRRTWVSCGRIQPEHGRRHNLNHSYSQQHYVFPNHTPPWGTIDAQLVKPISYRTRRFASARYWSYHEPDECTTHIHKYNFFQIAIQHYLFFHPQVEILCSPIPSGSPTTSFVDSHLTRV